MHKGVLAYIIVGIFLFAVFILWYLHWGLPAKPTTVSKTTSITTTASSNTTVIKNTTTIPTTTTIVTGSCLSSNSTVPLFNGDFSLGTYDGWNATGYGFGNAPLNITWANNNSCYFNTTWSNYQGNFFATTYHCGLVLQTGNLTSKPFKVVLPYLNFKIISPYNGQLYVEILKNGKPVLITHFDTYNAPGNINPTSTFQNASIPIAMFMCQNVSVRVVANVVGTVVNRLDYIAVGDFYQSMVPIATPGIVVNQTIV
ncbi:MAG: hypothetical protein ACP5P2_01030 [Candidatus Micrarchaeia archaeon]|jgi:hypothetical protein